MVKFSIVRKMCAIHSNNRMYSIALSHIGMIKTLHAQNELSALFVGKLCQGPYEKEIWNIVGMSKISRFMPWATVTLWHR